MATLNRLPADDLLRALSGVNVCTLNDAIAYLSILAPLRLIV